MNADEVVVHVEQGDRVSMIRELLAERIRQTGKSADVHPHGEILPLHVGRADVLRIGFSSDFLRHAGSGRRFGGAYRIL